MHHFHFKKREHLGLDSITNRVGVFVCPPFAYLDWLRFPELVGSIRADLSFL